MMAMLAVNMARLLLYFQRKERTYSGRSEVELIFDTDFWMESKKLETIWGGSVVGFSLVIDIIEVRRLLRFGTEVALELKKALNYIILCDNKRLTIKNIIYIGGEKRVYPIKFMGRRERRRVFSSEGFKTLAQGQILA